MKIVLHKHVDLAVLAGMKVWMLGYTHGQTRILNPIEAYLYVEKHVTQSRERLTLVRVSASGNIIPVFDIDHENNDEGDGTIVFIAKKEEDLFEIPMLVLVQRQLRERVEGSYKYRQKRGLPQESLFFNIDTD